MLDETNNGSEARANRDEAMRRVLRSEWRHEARAAFELLPTNWRGTGEDLRHALRDIGLAAPHHHNSWGAFVGALQVGGFLVPTGEMTQMKDPQSNGRKTPILMRPVVSAAA